MQVRLSGNGIDYKVDKIPNGVLGQSYVVLSRSDVDVSDEQIVAGPAILEVCLFPEGGGFCSNFEDVWV